MKLDIKRVAIAFGAAWAVWYSICALMVAVAPEQTQAVFSFAMHYDLSGSRHITWPSFFGGLVLTTAWVAVFAATVGGFFNMRSGSGMPEHLGGPKSAVPK